MSHILTKIAAQSPDLTPDREGIKEEKGGKGGGEGLKRKTRGLISGSRTRQLGAKWYKALDYKLFVPLKDFVLSADTTVVEKLKPN